MRYLTTAQVAQAMGVSSNTVRRWITDRGLQYSDIGVPSRPRIRITQDDLDAWVKSQRTAA